MSQEKLGGGGQLRPEKGTSAAQEEFVSLGGCKGEKKLAQERQQDSATVQR